MVYNTVVPRGVWPTSKRSFLLRPELLRKAYKFIARSVIMILGRYK